jgi:hypothetical protein
MHKMSWQPSHALWTPHSSLSPNEGSSVVSSKGRFHRLLGIGTLNSSLIFRSLLREIGGGWEAPRIHYIPWGSFVGGQTHQRPGWFNGETTKVSHPNRGCGQIVYAIHWFRTPNFAGWSYDKANGIAVQPSTSTRRLSWRAWKSPPRVGPLETYLAMQS